MEHPEHVVEYEVPSMERRVGGDVGRNLPSFVPTPEHIQELDRLGDQIAELAAHLDAATFRLLELIREFDARGGWANGARSCADWLSWRVGLGKIAARDHVRVARALAPLPRISAAFACGEISYSKVRAITRVATPETEERLLNVARCGTAVHVERIVRGWRQMDRKAEADEAARHNKSRSVRVHHDEDGMVVISGRLAPEVGAVVMRALEAARETLYPLSPAEVQADDAAQAVPSREQQQADALALLAETALHQGLDPGTPGERYQVVVHVDGVVLADAEQPGQSVLEDGVRVPAESSQRLACDASRVLMRHDVDGNVVEVGARTRTIPPALRRVLQHRDHGCRFPGCGFRFGQGHHIRHWAQGGPTTVSNLVLLCRRHHRSVHEDGYTVQREADGSLKFRRPDGRELPEVPSPFRVTGDPAESFRQRTPRSGFIRARRRRTGTEADSTSAGRSTCCIRSRTRFRESITATGLIEM